MKLIDQVCTLEQGERLKELGVNVPSGYYHSNFFDVRLPAHFVLCRRFKNGIYDDETGYYELAHFNGNNEANIQTTYPAYNLSEMGQMIGSRLADEYWQHLAKLINSGNSSHVTFHPKQVAKFIIEMLETNVITAESINNGCKN